MKLTVFFLCAGFGSRLAPLTKRLPKPLIPFLGESALKRNWKKVLALKPHRIICNSHHLPDAIRTEAQALGIEVFHEEVLLGTGGCLVPVREVLEETDFFLVHNGDVLHSIDLQDFVATGMSHYEESHGSVLGTLSGIDRTAVNSLSISSTNMLLQGVHGYEGYAASSNALRRTYSGIALYHRDFLSFLEPYLKSIHPDALAKTFATEFDIKPIWKQVLKSHGIAIADHSSASWFDFGTPQGLWDAYKWTMEQEKVFLFPERNNSHSQPNSHPYLSNEAGWEELSEESSHAVVLEKPLAIDVEKSKKTNYSTISHQIVGQDFCWEIQ